MNWGTSPSVIRATVLIPLPGYGFDPTESAIPWKKLKQAGRRVVFATPDGRPARADVRMLTGQDLPLFLRKSLMAEPEAVRAYEEMSDSPEFRSPLSYEEAAERARAMASAGAPAAEAAGESVSGKSGFSALLLPGGHDKGMREYLESPVLQNIVALFFAQSSERGRERARPVGAICHGTLLAARSRSGSGSGLSKSVLWGRKTTGLTRNQEMIAFHLTRIWLGDYYRTYEIPMADELVSNLRSPADYSPGPGFPIPLRTFRRRIGRGTDWSCRRYDQ